MILPVQKPDFTQPGRELFSLAGNQPAFVSEGVWPGAKYTERPPAPTAAALKPWEIILNGDDTVHIAAGSIMSYDELSLTLREFYYFAGTIAEAYTPITVTGAGSIYGRINALPATLPDINFAGTDSNGDGFTVELLRVFPDSADSVLFSFETTVPKNTGIFYFEIAKVELDGDGNVAIVRQLIDYNLTLSSWKEGP